MSQVSNGRKRPHFAKHFFAVWAATPIVCAGIAWAIFTGLDAPSGQVNSAVLLAVLLGAVGGWALSLGSWVIRWGIHGWLDVIRTMRAQGSASPYEVQAFDPGGVYRGSQHHEPAPPRPLQLPADPWHGENPYGCCTYNQTSSGFPTHGGPDCLHPEAKPRRR